MAAPIGAAVVAGALGGFTKTMTGKALAKICYLFMLADGQSSDTEKKLFTQVCKKVFDVDANTRERIEEECEKIPVDEGPDNWRMAIREIGKVMDEEHLDNWLEKNECTLLLWTLINIGYADTEYSKPERIVTDYVAKEFKIAQEDYYALQDIAETMTSLVEQKEWLKLAKCTHEEFSEEMNKIDETMKRLEKSIATIVEQADIGA